MGKAPPTSIVQNTPDYIVKQPNMGLIALIVGGVAGWEGGSSFDFFVGKNFEGVGSVLYVSPYFGLNIDTLIKG